MSMQQQPTQQQPSEMHRATTGYRPAWQSTGQPVAGQSTGQPVAGQWSQQPMTGQPTAPRAGQQQPDLLHSGGSFESTLTVPMRLALRDVEQSLTTCEWCADRCLDHGPEMAACVRLCRDVAEIAETNVELMARDSIFGPEAARLFVDAAEECARECASHPEPHCQECASVLGRAIESTRTLLSTPQPPAGQQSAVGQQTATSQQPTMGQQPPAGQQSAVGQQFGPY